MSSRWKLRKEFVGASDQSSFHDDNPFDWDYYPPEYAVIPWNAHGPGILTVKLPVLPIALWRLAMIAANGDRCIDYSYPDLNIRRQEGEMYIHDTSSTTLAKLPPSNHLQEVNLAAKDEKQGGCETPPGPEGSCKHEAAFEDMPYYSQPGSAFGGDDNVQEDEG